MDLLNALFVGGVAICIVFVVLILWIVWCTIHAEDTTQ